MRTRNSTSIVMSVALAACAGDAPTALQSETAVVRQFSASSVPRPIDGSCQITSSTFVSLVPPILNRVSTATCTVSHLGRVTLVTQQHINVVTGVQNAESTFTTAAGDQLHATSVGSSSPAGPNAIDFTGVTTITGGTDRFAGATGEMQARGHVSTVDGTGTLRYHGWIVYDASQISGH